MLLPNSEDFFEAGKVHDLYRYSENRSQRNKKAESHIGAPCRVLLSSDGDGFLLFPVHANPLPIFETIPHEVWR